MGVGKVPDQVSTPTITTDNATTTTYTWTSPFNGGLQITKYGYRIYTNNGSAGAEQFTADGSVLSYSFNSQYDTSVYKIDVRAYNILGPGEYSTISANNVPWVENTVSRSQSCSCTGTDTSGCDSCGSRSSTTTGGTQSRNCKYKSKTGYADGPDYDCGAFGACANCTGTTTYGDCTGSWTDANVSGTYNGISYTYTTDFLGMGSFLYQTNNRQQGCDSQSSYCYNRQYCSVTNTYRITAVGCVRTSFK